ncbi:Glutathione transferase [Candidatus Rhodobacter oscarellae]|uniref:Glutathione transferase n=1 Tax=Candidatus Rhodobacter oscarellae TaxID=1675527 RepID=A0A0J9GSM4_9RHOB|nr:glutathione S-transferase family protein [Candidatus Rhodobacter lobularis]KMW56508.1 Glutathione transferase [Candidatus Rhodobacter lobularis]
MTLRLVGYRHSVYAWAVRMALAELGQQAEWHELDPFAPEDADALAPHHPFGRVPVLWDGETRIYETGAILAYLFAEQASPLRAARGRQVAGIVDNYAYLALVRGAFAHGAFRPWIGEAPDPEVLAQGLDKAPRILAALDEIAAEGVVLARDQVGPADCHLAPMIGYFAMTPGARALLARHAALSRWFDAVSGRESYLSTRPPIFTEGSA